MTEQLIVPRRYCGPPSSGNGGWTAGALAGLVPDASAGSDGRWPAIRVSLRRPPPLDTPMAVTTRDGVTVASLEPSGEPVADARTVEDELALVDPVAPEQARAATADYPGLTSHPFPTCFVCGPGREPADGLRIFPGQVADSEGATRVAATWTPDPSLAELPAPDVAAPQGADDVRRATLATTWAALDCIGGWAGDLTERLMVLAAVTARVDALPVIGEEHVVVGAKRGRDGRKTFTAATLYDHDGRVVALAEHLWIAVDADAFR